MGDQGKTLPTMCDIREMSEGGNDPDEKAVDTGDPPGGLYPSTFNSGGYSIGLAPTGYGLRQSQPV